MNRTLPAELEQHVQQILRGDYPTREALFVDAVSALVRERERMRIEVLLTKKGFDDGRIERLLQEAAESGDYREMTAQDWEDIEREGLALAQARKPAQG